MNGLWTVGAYASLSASVARDDPAWAKFEADIRAKSAAIGAESLFFTLELNQLEEWEIEAALRAEPAAARFRPWLRRVRLGRPHELSADLERMLVDRAPAMANWTRLYDETLSRMSVHAGARGASPWRRPSTASPIPPPPGARPPPRAWPRRWRPTPR